MIQKYEDGNLEDESKLKMFFKDKVLFKEEWIEYSDDIVKFFKDNDTIEKLRESLKDSNPIKPLKRLRKQKIDKYLIEFIYNTYFSSTISDPLEKIDKIKEIEDEICFIPKEKHIKYFSYKYSISVDTINIEVRKLKSEITNISEDVYKAVEQFEKTKSNYNKFKFLVKFTTETPGITKEDINYFMSLVPEKYKEYYTLLGPDRIRANSYQESKIKQEWLKIHSGESINDNMILEIYNTFIPGNKYSKSSIKQKLKNIYETYSYSKTAKASDLEEYFIIRTSQLKEDSKWVNGFEILGKR